MNVHGRRLLTKRATLAAGVSHQLHVAARRGWRCPVDSAPPWGAGDNPARRRQTRPCPL